MFYEYNRIDSPDYFTIEEGTNFSFPEHLHVCFELITILSGEMQVKIDDKTFNLTKGEALLIFPHQLHSLKSDKSKHMLCIFSPNLVKSFYNNLLDKVPINNKFQPDQYLINSLLRINNNGDNYDDYALRIKRKGILYSLCSQFHESYHSGFTSSWISSNDIENENNFLKITFNDPTLYNSSPNILSIFCDDGTVDITEYIDCAYLHMWIKSSKKHKIELSLSNFEGDQKLNAHITINTSDVWQQVCIPLKNMHHSKNFGKIVRLTLSNNSVAEGVLQKDDYISLAGIRVVAEQPSFECNNKKILWKITTKTPEYMTKYRTQQSDTNSLLYKIFLFVEKNFANDCSLTSLTKITGYDYAYLSRFFKNSTSFSFTSYVNNYRLNHACYLLESSNDSIIECALASGYKSIRTFNRNFKEKFGITPEAFRLNRRGSSTN